MNKITRKQLRGITRRLSKVFFHLLDTEVKSIKYKKLIQDEIIKIDKLGDEIGK